VKATTVIDGVTYSPTATVTFGDGPLSVFGRAAPTAGGTLAWYDAASHCGGSWGDAYVAGVYPGTKLPSADQLKAVSGPNQGGQNGAVYAAAWPNSSNGIYYYWTNESGGGGKARFVRLETGYSTAGSTLSATDMIPATACLR
jgi:hypothetical protein